VSKNIVICCDGTGNEFGAENSNVVKLYQRLISDPTQVMYYHPGVGTMGSRSALSVTGKWWTKVIGLAFGYGIFDNVADAYIYLMRRFHPGDNVYIFGFSRGAYTARALCGMLHAIGLLREDNEALIPYAIRLLKGKQFDIAPGFKKTFSRAFLAGRIFSECGTPLVPSAGSTMQCSFHTRKRLAIPISTSFAMPSQSMREGHSSDRTCSVSRFRNRTFKKSGSPASTLMWAGAIRNRRAGFQRLH
jgi:Uncharacterized alpha/beta hydrolase domain (DUF2235)